MRGSRLQVGILDEQTGIRAQSGTPRTDSIVFDQNVVRSIQFVAHIANQSHLGFLLVPLQGGFIVQLVVTDCGLLFRRNRSAVYHGIYTLFEKRDGHLARLAVDCAEFVETCLQEEGSFLASFLAFDAAQNKLYSFKLELIRNSLASEDIPFVEQLEATEVDTAPPKKEPGIVSKVAGYFFGKKAADPESASRWEQVSLKYLGCQLVCAVFADKGRAEAHLINVCRKEVMAKLALPMLAAGQDYSVHLVPFDVHQQQALRRKLAITLVIGRVTRDFESAMQSTNVDAESELTLWSVLLHNEERDGCTFGDLLAHPNDNDGEDICVADSCSSKIALPSCSLLAFYADAANIVYSVFDWASVRPQTVALDVSRGVLESTPLWSAEDSLIAGTPRLTRPDRRPLVDLRLVERRCGAPLHGQASPLAALHTREHRGGLLSRRGPAPGRLGPARSDPGQVRGVQRPERGAPQRSAQAGNRLRARRHGGLSAAFLQPRFRSHKSVCGGRGFCFGQMLRPRNLPLHIEAAASERPEEVSRRTEALLLDIRGSTRGRRRQRDPERVDTVQDRDESVQARAEHPLRQRPVRGGPRRQSAGRRRA